jgi:hypothetical protein
MDIFSEAIEDFRNVLDAATTDSQDVADLNARNAIQNLIRALGQLGIAVTELGKANR